MKSDPAQKKIYINFAMVRTYYENPDISFNSSWQRISFLNVEPPFTRSQILSSNNSEESYIFIYTFLCIL